MSKFKRLLSVLTSTAIAASMLSAFATSANAKTDAVSLDWENAESSGFSDAGRGATTLVTDFEGHTGTAVEMHNAGGSKGTVKNTFDAVSGTHVGMEYDAYFTTNQTFNKYIAIGTSDIGRMSGDTVDTANTVLTVGNYTSGTISVNKIDTGIAAAQWIHVEAVADFDTKKVNVTITPASGTEYKGSVDFLDTNVTAISGVTLNSYRGVTDKAIYVDNLVISTYDEAEIEIKEDPVTIKASESAQIAVVTGVANDDAIEVSSADESVVTASVSEGVVTAEYVGDGKTAVTIKATSPDGVSITKTVSVIAGDIALSTVNVKYVDTESSDIADGYSITDVPVGSVITSKDVQYNDTVLTDAYRYTNPSVTDYTVINGENTLYVVYADKAAAVNSITVSYKIDGAEVASKTEELASGLYVGDSYTYYSTAYVTAEDGKIYAVGDDYTEDKVATTLNGTPTAVNAVLKQTITLEENTVVEYTAVESPNAVFYSEWEDALGLTPGSASNSRYIASGGKFATMNGAKSFYEITESGYYQIVYVGGPKKRGTAIFETPAAAEAATAYDDETALISVLGDNNDAYGIYAVATKFLEVGDNLTLKGFGTNGATDNLDYILLRRIVSGDIIGASNVSITPIDHKTAYTFDSGLSVAPTWSVTGVEGVTIDENGVLTVSADASEGTATIKAEIESAGVSGTLNVNIAKVQVTDFSINGPAVISNAKEAIYSVKNATDQFGADITEYVNAEWSLKDNGSAVPGSDEYVASFVVDESYVGSKAIAIFPTYKTDNTLDNVHALPVDITGTTVEVPCENGQKVMLWDSFDGAKPLAPIGTGTAKAGTDKNSMTIDGVLSVNVKRDETVVANVLGVTREKDIKIADYSKVIDAAEGEVSVNDIVTYDATSFNVVFDDGTVVEKTAEDNKITIAAADIPSGAAKMEIIPNYKFNLGGAEAEGYVVVSDVNNTGYGFTNAATPADGTGSGIQSKGVELVYGKNAFEVDLPDGRYDMTFYKADTSRTHIKVNGFYTVPEADYTDGDGSDPITAPGVYTQRDVIVTGGVAKITADDWSKGVPKIAAVEITKKSDFEPRKKHIWIAGDSTVTNYRPTPTRDDWKNGTRRTGWGQLFQNYLDDSVIVDDFAHSGDYSVGWYNSTFPAVLQYAQPGDYFFVQFGINDRADKNNCPTSLMEEYLGKYVDECRAIGVIPVLITPEICISQYGSVGEHEKSTGSGNGAWFNTNKTVSAAKNVLLIDLADLSGNLWATMGRTWVAQNYFLWDSVANKAVDPQHMAYQGAKIVASLVATEILDQKEAGKTGEAGETFDGIPVNAKVQANITYTDAADSTQKTVERQAAEFKAN